MQDPSKPKNPCNFLGHISMKWIPKRDHHPMASSIPAHSKVNPRQKCPKNVYKKFPVRFLHRGQFYKKIGYLHSSRVNPYKLPRPSLLKGNEQNKKTRKPI